MIRLIAADMDGTLLDDNKKLPPQFSHICSELEKRNIIFAVSSGRSFSAVKYLFKDIDMPGNAVYICDNGGNIILPDAEPIQSIIPDKTVKDIIKDCEQNGHVIPVLCCVNDIYYPSYAKQQFEQEITNFYKQYSVTDDICSIKDPVIKIAICDIRGALDNAYPVFNEKYGGNMTVVPSGLNWMDIMNKNIDKGFGIRKIQEHYSIKKSETMAFGDYFNDVPMLSEAEYSYVMANSCDEMKQYGRYAAPPNTENGVLKIICENLGINLSDESEEKNE